MGLIEQIKGGISRVIWKGVKHAGTAAAGIVTVFLMDRLGYSLSAEHQLAVAAAVTGALGSLLKFLKDRFNRQLGWL